MARHFFWIKIIDHFILTKRGNYGKEEKKAGRYGEVTCYEKNKENSVLLLQGKREEEKTLMTPGSILPLSPFSALRLAARRAKLGAVMSLNCKCFFFFSIFFFFHFRHTLFTYLAKTYVGRNPFNSAHCLGWKYNRYVPTELLLSSPGTTLPYLQGCLAANWRVQWKMKIQCKIREEQWGEKCLERGSSHCKWFHSSPSA